MQCYALKTWLEMHGHDVYVINYRPPYHTVRYMPHKNPFRAALATWRNMSRRSFFNRLYITFGSFVKSIIGNIKHVDKERYRIFQKFTSHYFNETAEYRTLKALKRNPPELDLYISGSDQLWNPVILDASLDAAYFLDFGPKETRKITYAVSTKEKYSEEEKQTIEKLSKNLDAISLREQNYDVEISVSQPVHICIDPTLLLDLEDYTALQASPMETEPYLFVYGFQGIKEIDDAVRIIADSLHLRVINGSPKVKLTTDHKKVYDYGPREFLSYIANADFVVSNSFHATAFSIIYQKNFVVVPHTTRGRRMIELLGKLGLSDRLWYDDSCAWQQPLDYEDVRQKLSDLRTESESYLLDNLAQ